MLTKIGTLRSTGFWFVMSNKLLVMVYPSNETHGLQILTEEVTNVQDIAFDSRAVINDKTFSINAVAPASNSWSYSNIRTQFTYDESDIV